MERKSKTLSRLQQFIAEIKCISPHGMRSDTSWETLRDVAIEHGDWISVHTDPRWGGSIQSIADVRERTNKRQTEPYTELV